MARRTVCIVTFDGMQPLDAIGPFEVFAGATKVLAAQRRSAAGYELALVSEHGAPVTAESGLQIVTARLPPGRTKFDTLLIPGGDGAPGLRRGSPLVEWIRRAATIGRGRVLRGGVLTAPESVLVFCSLKEN